MHDGYSQFFESVFSIDSQSMDGLKYSSDAFYNQLKGSVIIISLKHGLKLGIFYDSLAGSIILFFGMCNLQLKAKKTVFCFF